MITGAHAILYSSNADADRRFLRDVVGLPNVDVGGGWLIFGLPPSEVAVHPAEKNGGHELFLMCDDVEGFMAEMREHGLDCTPIQEQRWGRLTHVTLPGGGRLGIYEPRHARPLEPPVKKALRRDAKRTGRKTTGRTVKQRRQGR